MKRRNVLDVADTCRREMPMHERISQVLANGPMTVAAVLENTVLAAERAR